MAETAVLFVLHQFYKLAVEETYKLAVEEVTLLKEIQKGFKDIKHELESIKAFLKDADTRAGDNEGVKAWVDQLRETSFCIEDVIDEYVQYLYQKVKNSGNVALIKKVSQKFKTVNQRDQIASAIRDIKSSLVVINERRLRYDFKAENGPGSSRGATQNENDGDPTRMASRFIEPSQIVGFEEPTKELVSCLVEGTKDLVLVSVVGMGGLGKTTLSNHVFRNELVEEHFDYRLFITVSQSYTVRELLINMVKKFYKDNTELIPKDLQEMDCKTLIDQVIQFLESKRYLLLFDDVWTENFSDDIEHALINNNKGSRIIVTTRMMPVAEYFKKSFNVHIHELQFLPKDKADELFRKKAFRSHPENQCPKDLVKMSNEIVQKCGGLPLAIVAIGGLLSTKTKTIEWEKVITNLRMELQCNAHLYNLRRILSLSYDDLPCHLKSCMLYFGIYPEDYTINRKRLTRQWMAEGFVRYEKRRTLEDVAEEYLTELIQRSLVNVFRIGFDGKVKSCQVHDMLHEVIIKKMEDLSFCHLIREDDEQVTVGITRRFSIAAVSNNDLTNTSNLGIRAIFIFNRGELSEDFMDGLSAKFKLLKVLDFENSRLNSIPDKLGNLFHLRYLNLSHTKVTVLPKSIGMLVNLETLDLRQTKVHELPKEIKSLTKLRLLPVYYRKYEGQYSMLNFTDGLKMQKVIGSLTSLQKLYFLEAADDGGVDLIRELGKLTQLRKLGIKRVRQEHANALCAAIQEMKRLESLNIGAKDKDETLDLDFLSTPPPNLRVLNLKGKLTNLPNWIPNLNYLVKLRIGLSNFKHDPLDSLKSLPYLLRLNLWDDAFAGDYLHFKVGGFQKLKEIDLTRLNKLSSISIDKEALPDLEHFRFKNNPQLKVLPQDLQNLKNLQFLGFAEMPDDLVDSIDPEKDGRYHWIIDHIPLVQIRQNFGPKFHQYTLRRIPTQINI